MELVIAGTLLLIGVTVAALLYLIRSITRLAGEFRLVMNLFFASVVLAFLFLTTLFVLAVRSVPLENNWWYLFTVLFALTNLVFALFGKKLYEISRLPQEESTT